MNDAGGRRKRAERRAGGATINERPDVNGGRPTLFEGLSEADLTKVIGQAATVDVPARTVLCRQGDVAGSMFVVRAGRVHFARTTAEGRDVLLLLLGRGECFGLASLVPGHVNYIATAVATRDATLYEWDARTIQSAAVACPRLAQNALRLALHYVEYYGERHESLVSRSAEERIALALTHLAATKGEVLMSGVEVEITNHDLASLADVGMFTVSRQLKRWERDGHLLKRRQRVLLRHPEALLAG